MSDELLPYYKEELDFLRSLMVEFEGQHKKVSDRLQLIGGRSKDPHVERLLMGVSMLNARLRRKLDDDFPEMAEAFLQVIYPHYLRPIPSIALVQFDLDNSQADLIQGATIPRGTYVETEPEANTRTRCRFRTCYPVELWPLTVEEARFSKRPFDSPRTRCSEKAKAALKIHLRSWKTPLRDFALDKLRIWLDVGGEANVYQLYEMLFVNRMEVAVSDKPDARLARKILPAECLQPVGFDREESLLPYDARTYMGYRLLTEYFAFPQKYLFFDLVNLSSVLQSVEGRDAFIYVFLDRSDAQLERDVTESTFRLGCTPLVNLFSKPAEPFELTQTRTKYLVEPDARNVAGHEVYSIDEVEAVSPAGEVVHYQPIYSFRHGMDRARTSTFWWAESRPSRRAATAPLADQGRDAYLTFVDLNFSPAQIADWTVRVETTCFNRQLTDSLPNDVAMDMPDGRGVVGALSCLVRPTSAIRPAQDYGAVWRLVSHLSLNHLSLGAQGIGADALREILLLYDFKGSDPTRAKIAGVQDLNYQQVIRRVGRRAGGFGRGIKVQLELDETKFRDGDAYLFASVLNRFFGLYTTVNSFTELEVQTKQRAEREEPWTWPRRTGEHVLL